MKKILEKSSVYIFLFLLAYMPVYVFLSTWIGTSTGLLDVIKISKEVLLVIGFLLALVTASKQTLLKLTQDKLVWLIALYAAVTIVIALVKHTDQDAEAIAVVYNLRFLLFFVYAALLVHKHGRRLVKTSIKTVLGVGVIVALLGVFQVAVLPDDGLSRVGYSRANGTPAVFYISDETKAIERAYSTAKDPNSLGSYLIILLSFSVLYLLSRWPRDRNLLGGITLAVLLCLFLTYSRSAWIGSAIAITLLVLLLPRTREMLIKYKKRIAYVSLAALLIAVVGLASFRNTSIVQNLVFHVGDDAEVTSNSGRTIALDYTIEKIADNPLGYGPGTAGPASFKNDVQGAVIPENYYLQLAHEVGIQGLLVFLAICIVVFIRLYRLRKIDLASIALVASFVGIGVTNLLVHIWFFEPVAYTWWGIAGLVVYQSLAKPNSAIRPINNNKKLAKI
jgi:O-antigen ligase